MSTNACYGCDEDNPFLPDHHHYYTNFFNQPVLCVWLDGQAFRTRMEAAQYLKATLECNIHEAVSYLQGLPTRRDFD